MKNIDLFGLFRHVTLIALAALFLLPFVWMVLTSFKPEDEIFVNEIRLIPERFAAYENYSIAFSETPLVRFMLNGVIVTVAIFLSQIAIAVPASYALAKLNFKGKQVVFIAILACLMIPPQAVSIPWYLLMYKFGWLNSYEALIAPFSISVFGIFLMRQFFNSVPDDLISAARLDGFSEFGIIWRIMVPTAIPALIAFGIFSIVAHWNDYFWPLIVANSQDIYTPPLGVVAFKSDEAGDSYGPLMAAATVIVAPLIIAYLCAQKRFIEGITMSGMK
ncbi:glycerol-3-phosphate ABC transporter permease protein UgpE [Vibrio maritimus]|uniref:Glycerol-3-phosphate ABC transporter permease protein UgpE n=1 Tax=Vibrio maritimus TaxID=990268 RepID=A0A090T747_9VIBR|nr:glycerol-3-phosphate ABC transporter permease protein UgpE [Vibrio maritimus]